MMVLLDGSLKVSVMLLLAFAATALLRRRSAALRHSILAAAIACAAATPLLQRVAPSWEAGVFSSSPVAGRSVEATASEHTLALSSVVRDASLADDQNAAVPRMLVAVWLIGVVYSLLGLLAGLVRLSYLAAKSERVLDAKWTVPAEDMSQAYELSRPVVLLQSDHPTLLVTWGLLQPEVILPTGARDWSGDRIRVVLFHELAHIRRRDWLLQMTAELLRSIYWFNPLTWIARTRLRLESEYACDDTVLRFGVKGSDYATHLLDLARTFVSSRVHSMPDSSALAMARPSTLERRIRAMLNDTLNRRPVSRGTSAAGALVWFGLAVAIAGFATTARTAALSLESPAVKVVPLNILDRTNGGARGRQTAEGPSVGAVTGASFAQVGAFATLTGTMTDQLGGLLPAVTVSLTNRQSGARYEIRTNRSGEFEFVGLQPGNHTFEASLPGFTTIRRNIDIGTGGNQHIDIRLAVGSIQETLRITGSRSAPSVVSGDTAARSIAGGRPAAPACSAPVAGGIGGNIKAPRKIRDVRPIYSAAAQSAGIEGTISLKATIGTDGYVKDVEVEGNPNPDLASSAVAAVREWEFTEVLLNCVPIEIKMNVSVTFSLGQ